MPQPCVHQTETCVCQCGQGLGAGMWVWRTNLGRRLLLAVRRHPEGMGVRKSATGNACGRNADHHTSKAPLLTDMQGGRTAIAASLPMHWSLPSQALGRTPTGAGSLMPMAAGYPTHPIPLRAPANPAAAASAPSPHQGGHMCSGATSGADPCGWPTCRGGVETTAEPHELCN